MRIYYTFITIFYQGKNKKKKKILVLYLLEREREKGIYSTSSKKTNQQSRFSRRLHDRCATNLVLLPIDTLDLPSHDIQLPTSGYRHLTFPRPFKMDQKRRINMIGRVKADCRSSLLLRAVQPHRPRLR